MECREHVVLCWCMQSMVLLNRSKGMPACNSEFICQWTENIARESPPTVHLGHREKVMCCGLFSNVTDRCGWSLHICIFLFDHWFNDFSAVWHTGSIRGLWSPSGRASCTLSTCRPSHGCPLVGLTLSERSGGPPTAELLTETRMLQVSGLKIQR